jgi:hypothetical protein
LKIALYPFYGLFLCLLFSTQITLAQIKMPGGLQLPGGGGGKGGGGGGRGGGGAILDDSTKQIYGPNTTLHFYEKDILNNRDSLRYRVDTLVKNFHRWSPFDQAWGTMVDLGNTGTASRNLFFQPREDIGTQLGMRAYDAYAIQQDEVQYIDTHSQHTDLSFISGGKKTTLGRFGYTQNVNPRFNFGMKAQRLTSTKQYGVYSAINSESLLGQNWTFLVQTSYFSKDKKYVLLAHYRHLNQKVREQGGVMLAPKNGIIDPYPYDGSARTSNDANSWERRHVFHVYQQYRLANGFQVFQQGDFQSVINRYTDLDAAQGLENGLYPRAYYHADTSRQDIYFKLFDNKFGLKGNYSGFNYRAYLRNRLYGMKGESQAAAGPESLHTRYRSGLRFDNIVGLWLGYYLKDSAQYVTAEGELNLANAVDFANTEIKLKGDINTRWGRAGIQTIRTAPDLLAQRYIGNHFQWNNTNFSPTNVLTAYASLPLKGKKFEFTPEIQIHQIDKFVYYDSTALPRQLDHGFRLYRIGAHTDIQLNRWNLSGRGFITLNDDTKNEEDNVLRIPKFFGSGQVTFDFLYAKVLFVQLGMSAIYRSSYLADAYMPVTQQFHLQNTSKLQQRVVVDAFINFRISRVRMFFKMAYINQGGRFNLLPKGYYISPTYLGMARALSFGINWPLFD